MPADWGEGKNYFLGNRKRYRIQAVFPVKLNVQELYEGGGPMQSYILYSVMITSFVGAFVGSGINVALPAIGQEFAAGAGDLSRVSSAFLFGSAIFALPFGKVADILGRKKIYRLGAVFFSITLIIGGFSQSVEFLSGVRFLQGALMAMVFGPGTAMLVSVYDQSMRGRILGYSTAAVYVGLTCGPVIGGLICYYIGWRWFFYLAGGLASIGLIFLYQVKEEWYGDRGASFDYKGSLLYMAMVPLILYGLSEMSKQAIGVYLLIAGIICMIIFVVQERRTAQPMLEVGLFVGNRAFSFSNLAALMHYAATFAVTFLMSLYLQVVCGLTAPEAGGVLLLQFIVMAMLSPKAGILSDRIAPGKVASVGMAINCICLFVLSTLNEDSSLFLVGGILMAVGVGYALFTSPNNNAIMGAIDNRFYGIASSLLATMRLIGQAVSMAIVTIVIDVNEVKSLSGADNDGLLVAMTIIYRIFAGICLLGIWASLARNRDGEKQI